MHGNTRMNTNRGFKVVCANTRECREARMTHVYADQHREGRACREALHVTHANGIRNIKWIRAISLPLTSEVEGLIVIQSHLVRVCHICDKIS